MYRITLRREGKVLIELGSMTLDQAEILIYTLELAWSAWAGAAMHDEDTYPILENYEGSDVYAGDELYYGNGAWETAV